MNNRRRTTIITAGSLAALVLGLLAGIALQQADGANTVVTLFELLGKFWVNTLILLMIPLVLSYLVYTVLAMIQTRLLGKLGGFALMVHVAIMVAGLVFSVLAGSLILESMGDILPHLTLQDVKTAQLAAVQESSTTPGELVAWSTAFQRTAGQFLLLMMFVTVVVSAITARYFKRIANRMLVFSKTLSEKSMRWMMVFLLSLPVAVFTLTLPMAADSGFKVVGVAGLFIVLISILLLAFILMNYLVVYLWGEGSIGRFARAMVPPQVMAFSTRSSMATMPALMETAEHNLDIPPALSSVVIPFFVTLFRSNRVISSPFNFLFLSYVYGLPIELSTFGPFLAAQIFLSFGTPGIPSGSKFVSLPLYLAAGIPLEGYILLKAVDTIPDIFKTLVNVTEVMAVTMVVARKFRWNSEPGELSGLHTP